MVQHRLERPGSCGYHSLITTTDARARRLPLIAILAMAAAAVLTGAQSVTAIAEWAADAPQPVRAAVGARRDAPDHWAVPAEATIRRTLARRDPEVLAGASARGWPTVTAPAGDGAPWRWTARRSGAPDATAARFTCWPRWTMPPARCWPNARPTALLVRFPACSRCWPTWTLTGWW